MNIIHISEFKAAEGKAEELFDFLKSLIPYISSSEGCNSVEIMRNKDNSDCFVSIEKWESVESHKKSINNFPKEEMQAAMNLFGAPPIGNYYHN